MLGREFERLPIVTLDRPIEGGRFESLLVENERGACLGTQHLIALGHKRIAYIGLENTLYVMRKRHKGYESAMKAARLGTRAAARAQAADRHLQRQQPVDAACAAQPAGSGHLPAQEDRARGL
jgi:LacI family transcriptional regulator